jgi:hypothetical protein
MGNFQKHYNKNYGLHDMPETSDYDELVYIINYGLKEGLYNHLSGKYCGDKANNLLIMWGYKEYQYEIY